MAGLEVLRVLHDSSYVTEAPIEVAVWTNEEGCRFAPAMVASGVFGGAFTLDYALAHQGPRRRELRRGAEEDRL